MLLTVLFTASSLCFAQAVEGTKGAEATVSVYRYGQYVGKGVRPSIYLDGRDIARIQSGRWLKLAIPAGKHSFRSSDQQSLIELDAKPGEEYFIRIDMATGMWKAWGRLTLVAKEQGTAELKKMKPVDRGMVKDPQVLAKDFSPSK